MQRAKKSVISKVALKEMLIRDLPELLKEDPLLRDYVASLFKENFAEKRTTEEEIKALLEEIKNLRIESEKRWEEHSKRYEEQTQILKEYSKRLEEHSKRHEEQTQILKEHSKRHEEHSKRFEEQTQILKEHSKRLEEHSKRIEEQTQILKEHSKRLEEHSQILKEHSKRLEEQSQILKEHSKRLEEHSQILKEHSKRLEEHSQILKEHSKKLEELSQGNKILMEEILALRKRQDVQIGALGARWGIKSEKTFRNAVKGLLEETFGVKVEHYETTDLEGEVFDGFPGKRVEIDLIIRDGELIVAEIKSSVSPADVLLFERKVKFFEKKEGRKVTRKIIISPMIDDEAKNFCKSLEITFYTDVPDREEGL